MANNVFLALVNGAKKWLTAITTSGGSGDAGKLVATNASGVLDITLMPGGLANIITAVASENLSAGDAVNLFDSSSTPKLRKADASSASKRCHGFVLSAFSSGATATAYKDGSITGLSALTDGGEYYLSTTPGQITNDVSGYTTSGNLIQHVGVAQGTTTLQLGIDNDPAQIG